MKVLIIRSLFVILTGSAMAYATLPPLSESDRDRAATHIVVGRVENVYTCVKVPRPGHENAHYVAEVVVRGVRKGAGVDTGSVVHAHYWRASRRPANWSGSSGQRSRIEAGETIRLYLKRDNAGRFSVLEPNGAEPDTTPLKGVRG